MKGKSIKKYAICLLMGMTLLFAGCGATSDTDATVESKETAATKTEEAEKETATAEADLLADMKEFALPNKSAALYLDKDWITEDAGFDSMLTAGDALGREVVFMIQFLQGSELPAQSIDDMKLVVEQTFSVSSSEELEAFEIPGMTDVVVYLCEMSPGGASCQAYVVYGKTESAFYSIGFMAEKLDDDMLASLKASCSKFTEVEENLVVEDATTVEITDTVRWFNASYAVLTELNGWDYNRFAGIQANESSKALQIASLEEWWGVTDRATADETLDWILSAGHRTDFVEDVTFLEEYGIDQAEDPVSFILENFELTEDEARMYVDWYEMYKQYGENAIAGWDYCRALNLMSFYYLAGYYTEQEALDKSLEIAQTVQPLFESWDELIESYMRGYEYWAGESSDERMAIYEDLKTREDNPYQVDFKTELQKTW